MFCAESLFCDVVFSVLSGSEEERADCLTLIDVCFCVSSSRCHMLACCP